MGFNLNRTQHPDYELKTRMVDEMISIYGVECDYLFTTKMNVDKILQDFTHLRLAEKDSKKVYLLPDDTAGWGGDLTWSMWGPTNNRTVSFYVSVNTLKSLYPGKTGFNKDPDIINSLVALPNGTLLEVTDVSDNVEGVNNLFTYKDSDSVYMLSTRVYYNRQQDNLEYNPDQKDVPVEVTDSPEVDFIAQPESDNYEESFESIDDYFKALEDTKIEQDNEGVPVSDSDSVFGSLG